VVVRGVLRKFLALSATAERAALDIYERTPLSLKHRLFYGPVFLRWLTLLQESEDWDRDRVRVFQLEQIRNLLVHSIGHVPYYRNLFSAMGFRPDRVQNFDDLRVLPYLDREHVRDNAEDFVDERRRFRTLVRRATGGSSGIPLTIYRSRSNEAAFLAFRARILARTGYRPGMREVMLWPDVKLRNKSIPSMRYGNKLVLSVRYLTGERITNYLDMIRKFEPEYLLGYPSVLTVLANTVRHGDLPPCRNMKAVISYAETLYDWQRELMEESFGCRVFSMYAMTERAAIGGECERSTGLHFHPLYGMTEYEDRGYGRKELVVTGFTNHEMPIIRYRTGDLISAHSEGCHACGRPHPVAWTIEGRSHEFLVGRNGELIPALSSWIGTFHNVLHCQFLQEQPGKVCLHIVPAKGFTKYDNALILRELGRILGRMKDALEVELNYVDAIPRTSSGKVRMIEQRLDLNTLAAIHREKALR
jgi:phenylacetate-CoA ligase